MGARTTIRCWGSAFTENEIRHGGAGASVADFLPSRRRPGSEKHSHRGPQRGNLEGRRGMSLEGRDDSAHRRKPDSMPVFFSTDQRMNGRNQGLYFDTTT